MGPMHDYFMALVADLQSAYPQLPFRARSDQEPHRLEFQNIDMELGFGDVVPEFDGVEAYLGFTGTISLFWRNDREAHFSWWTAQSLGHALVAWLMHRGLDHSRIIVQNLEVMQEDSRSDTILFQVSWYDEINITPQFTYEGHLVGPDPTGFNILARDLTPLGKPDSVEVELAVRNSE